MTAKKNILPYILHRTEKIDVSFDMQNNTIKYNNGIKTIISKVKIVNKLKILLLKHIPLVFIFLMTFNAPSFDITLFLSVLLFLIAWFFLQVNITYLQLLIYSTSIVLLLGVYFNFEIQIEQILSNTFLFIFFTLIVIDIYYLYQRDIYFYMPDNYQNFTFTGHQKLPQFLPKFIKEFKIKKINFFDFNLTGIYIKINKNELKNENI